MGSASHAISSIKQNRALQRAKSRSFLSKERFPSIERKYTKTFERSRKSTSSSLTISSKDSIVLLCIVIFSFLGSYRLLTLLNEPIKSQEALNPPSANNEAFTYEGIVYRKHIDRGYRYLKLGKLNLALDDFTVAKRMFETEDANYGMAVTLITMCSEQYRNCKMADEYYYELMKRNQLCDYKAETLYDLFGRIPKFLEG